MTRFHRILWTAWISLTGAATGIADVPISGRILAPPDDARVALESVLPNYERVRLRLGGELRAPELAVAAPDADGFFELAAPDPGSYKVVVTAAGYLEMEYLLLPLYEATELAPLELLSVRELELTIAGPEGGPRPAALGIYSLRRARDGWRARLRLGRAGDDGVARIEYGPGPERLEILAPGHPLMIGEITAEEKADGTASGTLPPAEILTLAVADERGRPAAGVIAYQGAAIVPLGETDEEGRLRLAIPAGREDPFPVSFVAPGGQGGYLDLAGKSAGEVVSVALDPAVTLRGRVVDRESRDPLAGAVVWATRGEPTRTDSRGYFELVLPPVRAVRVSAAAEGHAVVREPRPLAAAAAEELVLALPPAAGLAGRVRDAEGRGLAGVVILAAPALVGSNSGPQIPLVLPDAPLRVLSSRGGHFRMSGLPAARPYRLVFEKEGFAPRRLDVATLEAFESRAGLEVVLDRGRVGVGQVVDEEGAAIAAAGVRLMPAVSGPVRRFVQRGDGDDAPGGATDVEGRFRIANLASGRYSLEVRAPDFAPARLPGVVVDEGAGELDLGTVVLAPGARIEGIVRDPDGAPLAGVEIRAQGLEAWGWFPGREAPKATTDAAGRFAISDLRHGESLKVRLVKKGYGAEVLGAVKAPTEAPLAIVLRPAARLSGQVLDSDRRPIAGATVSAVDPTNRYGGPNAYARTEADGSFLIEDVRPGRLTLRVHAESYQHYERQGLEVAAGDELGGIELILAVGAMVRGTVRDAAGKPVADARVGYSITGAGSGTTSWSGGGTDHEGRFELEGVRPGTVLITAQHGARRASQALDLETGVHTVDLVFESGFDVAGQVVDESGRPLAGAALTLESREQGVYYDLSTAPPTSAADGTFTISDVAAGSYVLRAAKQGFAPARLESLEVEGHVSALVLELGRGVALAGRILGVELAELANLRLSAYGDGAQLWGEVDFEGNYMIPGLGPGTWYVQAEIPVSGRRVAARIEIAEGDVEAHRDIEFPTGFTLAGVVASGAESLGGVNVFVNPAVIPPDGVTSGYNRVVTGSDGRFRVEHLPAGAYNLMLRSSDGPVHQETIELSSDQEMRIELSSVAASGSVLDPSGQPIAGAQVSAERLDAAEAALMPSWGGRAQTDSRGFFRMRLADGRWRLLATAAGHAPGEHVVEVRSGFGAEGLEFRLPPTEGITFEVVLASGAAPRYLQAAVLDASGRRVVAGTYEPLEGSKFRMSTVPPGSWELLIQADDSAMERVAVTSPGDLGSFQLRPGNVLSLALAALEGDGQMARVSLAGADGRPHVPIHRYAALVADAWPMMAGRAMISNLAPGTWSYVITHPDGRTWSGTAVVMPGGMTKVTVP